MTKSDWLFGTVVKVKDVPRLGRGIVAKWKYQGDKICVFVEFPSRDYSQWFLADDVEKVGAIELLSGIVSDA